MTASLNKQGRLPRNFYHAQFESDDYLTRWSKKCTVPVFSNNDYRNSDPYLFSISVESRLKMCEGNVYTFVLS